MLAIVAWLGAGDLQEFKEWVTSHGSSPTSTAPPTAPAPQLTPPVAQPAPTETTEPTSGKDPGCTAGFAAVSAATAALEGDVTHSQIRGVASSFGDAADVADAVDVRSPLMAMAVDLRLFADAREAGNSDATTSTRKQFSKDLDRFATACGVEPPD
ncbi:hypothetical protein AB5J55_42415 [Streptomyces sp. R11]|uniref:Uncharacterized protein n=1 Tax=Streptomyces sp. R11 TaxID=3238625 RepID=A0AB39NED1_9ACTN